MHTIKTRGRPNGSEKDRERLEEEEERERAGGRTWTRYRRKSEKEDEGVIKYSMADVKSGCKMHQVPFS